MSSDLIENWDGYLAMKKRIFQDKMRVEPVSSVSVDDFQIIQTIGTGSFGTVVLATLVNDDNYYAIKIIPKARLVKYKQVPQALNEKRLLLAINFPFIINMEYFAKDNSNIYFVLPFINGGEVFFHLRNKGKFDETLAAFYALQVVLAFEYLHYLDIVYRDLKPENLVIDRTGYIKITDLGFAKVVTSRTYTACGTPDYLAPEVILGKGYSHGVDWWALGVLIYEMTEGTPPFYSTDVMRSHALITAGSYKMIPSFSEDLKDIISKLLQVDVHKRLGMRHSGVNEVKSHRWFRSIAWLDLINRKVKPPFIPQVKGPGDTTNFDTFPTKNITREETDFFRDEFEDF